MHRPVCSTLLVLLTLAIPVAGQTESDARSSVESVMESFVAARNARDAEEVAKYFAPDYDQGNLPTGEIQIKSGEERYQSYVRAFQEGRMRNRMEAETRTFRLLDDDVALMDAELSFFNADGNADLTNFATFVFVRREGSWLIGAVRMSPASR